MVSMRLTRRQRWRQVILPAIFPAYITGGITAAGGAWNASIVAELVSWHHRTLNAFGLGNYIATASSQGKFSLLIAGGIVMSAFVVIVNRFVWRRLYRRAESRYTL
jgi:NitT/TauT family transport system permease protein